ncbi:n-terminal binuclear zn cluster-containing dna binding domain-containing [Trichoderma arundinaceum]|uniref:N-terminal binuclear zn cluster-containing dna binding domain-containing n=1 Tax=Trichoderma arundinaceum TaxID=490622 RepID=A0A395NLI0_TRIAR|nr:n-terminal binuclear zn cluster-containing dna binding domain-containing [Trichoderma arundinaceum]
MHESQQQQGGSGGRPYRSHLRPACVPCRRRKSRCQTAGDTTICLTCRAHQTECYFPGDSRSSQSPEPARRRRRRVEARSPSEVSGPSPLRAVARVGSSFHGNTKANTSASMIGSRGASMGRQASMPMPNVSPSSIAATSGPGQGYHDQEEESTLALGSDDDQHLNLHIVGPAATNDSQVLSTYLSGIPGATRSTRMIIPEPASCSRPVLFTEVQKRPVGVKLNRSPSAEKLEIIEKLLEPHNEAVIDECPESRFIWNLANEAVYSELHFSPGMSIIKAILLNIGGRPTTSLIGNGVLLGSAVSMAHSLGLNHNPLPWQIPQPEKYLRMKIWWALLVHDRWTSLAHGTPPHIQKSQYDVPPPTLEYIRESSTEGNNPRFELRAKVFISLVTLSEVLDRFLQYVYCVGRGKLTTTDLELALNQWIESLEGPCRRIVLRGSHLEVTGAANLRLAYLTAKLLLQRIQLEAEKQKDSVDEEQVMLRYSAARITSEEMLMLVQDFQPEHLGDFWMSVSSFSFPAAVNFLLRCALETESSPEGLTQSQSFRIAHDLITTLRSHQEEHKWDLGDVCLAQHAEIVEKILTGVAPDEQGGNNTSLDLQDFDASILDHIFPSVWDPLQNAW